MELSGADGLGDGSIVGTDETLARMLLYCFSTAGALVVEC